ncbi:hypothetical protein Tco_1541542 [Tanacetum coccineum]
MMSCKIYFDSRAFPNDIYYLIDSNNTAKDLWDVLERQMRGFEYGEQDRKAAILNMMINDLKKCGYKKDNCELNYKFLNNLLRQLLDTYLRYLPEWKQYGYKKKAMGYSAPLAVVAEKQTSSSANKKPEYVKLEAKKEDKKADEKKRDMSKTKMLLAKKDSDEQVLLAEDQAWMKSSSDLDQEINANMVFMAKMEKVLLDSEEVSSSAEHTHC